jgi:hypothetical protein
MFIEVFQPFQTRLIVCLSIACWFDNPVGWEAAVGILIREVILALNHEKWRDTPAFTIDTHNRCGPFPIAWLNCLASATSIYTGNNHCRANYTHHKAGFVEVVEIAVLNPIFCPHILY